MPNTCSTCHGNGAVASDCPYCRNADDFEFEQLRPGTCPACQGRGYLEEICPTCGGSGHKESVIPPLAKASNF